MNKLFVFKSRSEALTQLYLSHYITVVRETGKHHLLVEDKGRLEELGLHVKEAPIGPFNLLDELNPRTSLVSLSWAHPLTGVVRPIEEMSELCRKKGVLLHVDITMLGKMDLPCDFLTFTGKEHTFVIAKENFCPLFYEEIEVSSDEISLAEKGFDHLCTETARLKNQFEMEISPYGKILFQDVERAPHISCLSFPEISHEALLFLLHRKGLEAKSVHEEAISFHFSHETKEEEVEKLCGELIAAVQKLQMIGARV